MRSRVYGKRYGVRLSVSLAAKAWAYSSSKPAAAGLLLWARQAEYIDRLLQQRRANAGSAAYVVAEYRHVVIYNVDVTTISANEGCCIWKTTSVINFAGEVSGRNDARTWTRH